jgi:hypothetical protein
MSLPEAVAYLAGETDGGEKPGWLAPRPARSPAEPAWTPILPVPADAPPLLRANGRTAELINPKCAGEPGEHTSFAPASGCAYRNAAGELLGYVLRIEFERDGRRRKIAPQITFCAGPGGKHRWCIVPFPEPRPLYRLDDLAGRPAAPVLVVEGEKTCEASRILLPGFVVVTWPGGSKAIGRTDWSPLAGRDVLLLPDADQPGRDAVDGRLSESGEHVPGIAEMLGPIAKRVRVVEPPAGLPEGWDLADADGWSEADSLSWLLAHLRGPVKPTALGEPIDARALLDGGLPDLPKWLPLLGVVYGDARRHGVGRLSTYLLRHFVDPSLVVALVADWNSIHSRPPVPTSDLVEILERCAAWQLERERRHGR